MTSQQTTRNRKDWRVLNHTADLRLEVRGECTEELFLNAAKALRVVLVGEAEINASESRVLRFEAPNLEELLVEWLRELLFEHQVHGNIFIAAEIIYFSDTSLGASVSFGNAPGGNPMQFEIKGITYHKLRILRRDRGYIVRIIFDI